MLAEKKHCKSQEIENVQLWYQSDNGINIINNNKKNNNDNDNDNK